MIYDGLLVVALWMVAAAIVVIPTGAEVRPGVWVFQIYLLVVAWAYFAKCWRAGGQTLGMKAWRIRLVAHQAPVSWRATAVRFIGALLSLLCFGLGFAWSLFHPQRATWHDLLSGTWLVIDPPQHSQPPQEQDPQ